MQESLITVLIQFLNVYSLKIIDIFKLTQVANIYVKIKSFIAECYVFFMYILLK